MIFINFEVNSIFILEQPQVVLHKKKTHSQVSTWHQLNIDSMQLKNSEKSGKHEVIYQLEVYDHHLQKSDERSVINLKE